MSAIQRKGRVDREKQSPSMDKSVTRMVGETSTLKSLKNNVNHEKSLEGTDASRDPYIQILVVISDSQDIIASEGDEKKKRWEWILAEKTLLNASEEQGLQKVLSTNKKAKADRQLTIKHWQLGKLKPSCRKIELPPPYKSPA
ncbi:hypothetical protein KSP39_PZI016198 [Platanthera zijinensis]|uniref:Uncharacterized protein n=1 Tax=Platanthera zijinensis TaxID=2320716 RepID=A0AAP0B7D9_9ASPA